MAAQLDAATHQLLTCIRSFDESGEWGHQGALSCAHWLSWRIGIDPGTAREKVRVSRALGTLTAIDAALGCGQLSYAKVRALTRVANPENERRLLDIALASTGSQLERICRKFRSVVVEQMSNDGERLDDRRYVQDVRLPSGLVRIEAVLHPDEAALVMKAIESARAATPRGAAPVAAETGGGGRVTDASAGTCSMLPVTSRPDALLKVAESFLATGEAAASGGDRYQVFVHLEQDPVAPDGSLGATLDDGTRVPAETFRRISCDASVVKVTADARGNPLDIGRRTRTIPPAVRRALWSRDRGCAFPACTNSIYVHAHHIHHWAHGGQTNLKNLLLLCSTHHRLLHEGGFTVDRTDTGVLLFKNAKGRAVPAIPAAIEVPATAGPNWLGDWADEVAPDLGADTSVAAWDGSRVDYEWVVNAMLPAG